MRKGIEVMMNRFIMEAEHSETIFELSETNEELKEELLGLPILANISKF